MSCVDLVDKTMDEIWHWAQGWRREADVSRALKWATTEEFLDLTFVPKVTLCPTFLN